MIPVSLWAKGYLPFSIIDVIGSARLSRRGQWPRASRYGVLSAASLEEQWSFCNAYVRSAGYWDYVIPAHSLG